jgi:hypothetical protein
MVHDAGMSGTSDQLGLVIDADGHVAGPPELYWIEEPPRRSRSGRNQ